MLFENNIQVIYLFAFTGSLVGEKWHFFLFFIKHVHRLAISHLCFYVFLHEANVGPAYLKHAIGFLPLCQNIFINKF